MTGGYILLDLTKYNLEDLISSVDDLSEDYEISKDDFDAIMKKCKLSYNTAKPLFIKANQLYDNSSQKNVNTSNIFYDIDICVIPYINMASSETNMFIHLKKYDGKYYIFVSNEVVV